MAAAHHFTACGGAWGQTPVAGRPARLSPAEGAATGKTCSRAAGGGIIGSPVSTILPPGDGGHSKPAGALDPEATVVLLDRVRSGDEEALNTLLARCLPALKRWAHGRLPAYARDMLDTADLVQNTVIKALRHLDTFEARREGALQAYLRTALSNEIRGVIRYRRRRPVSTDVPQHLTDGSQSPLEAAIGAENMERYERALAKLRDEDREAIIARLELQYSYEELAVALDKPTPDAARVAVMRALKRLARQMHEDLNDDRRSDRRGSPPEAGER